MATGCKGCASDTEGQGSSAVCTLDLRKADGVGTVMLTIGTVDGLVSGAEAQERRCRETT